MVGNTVKLQQPMMPSSSPSKWKIVAMTSKPRRSCCVLAEKIFEMQMQSLFHFVSQLVAQSSRKNKENKGWRRLTVILPLNNQFKRHNSNSRKFTREVKITIQGHPVFIYASLKTYFLEILKKKNGPLSIRWPKTFIFFAVNQKQQNEDKENFL